MELVFAGFGGQGVLTSGIIVAEMALEEGKNVTWMPSYGPAMRGGKAYSVVKFSDEIIGGPGIEETDILVAMNKQSVGFKQYLKENGMLIVNSDAIDETTDLSGNFRVFKVPCLTCAQEVNNLKAANIVSLGAMIKACDLFDVDKAREVLKAVFVKKGKEKYVEANDAAFMAGYTYI